MNTIIVAYNQKFVIGNQGIIPWHVSDDLKFFKEITTGHACVMGRKTWESIPEKHRPLKNRVNIVVSNSGIFFPKNELEIVVGVNDIDFALNIAHKTSNYQEVFITGGSQIYQYCIENNLVDRVIASEIKNSVEGDAYFPNLKALGWHGEVLREYDEFTVMDYKNK